MLNDSTVSIIKETTSVVSTHAESITSKMYDILFEDYPETKAFFKEADPDQHKKLAAAIGAFAANIDNLPALSTAIDKMSRTHVSSGVLPEHYPIVGTSLLKAIKFALEDAATEEVLDAWKEAFFFLADILIQKEQELLTTA